MISRQTRQIFSTCLHKPTCFKLLNHELLSLSTSSSFVFPTTKSPYPIYSFPQRAFSNSSKDDNDPNSNKKSDSKPKPQPPKTSTDSSETDTVKNTTTTISSNDEIVPKRLVSVPLKPMKLPIDPEEEKLKPETYILVSTKASVIPFTKHTIAPQPDIPAQYKNKKRAFFIKNDMNEIYTVGVILDIDRQKPKTSDNVVDLLLGEVRDLSSTKEKPKHYKVKLIEIEQKDNVFLAKAIPYNDSKLTTGEKQINVKNILTQIANLAQSIRQAVFNERLDVFGGPVFEWIHSKNIEGEKIDELLCQLMLESEKLYVVFKEDFRIFVQAFLEQQSPILRMFLVKKKLEEIKSVLDIVNKSIQHADEQIFKIQEQAKARLSLDFIRANFLSGAVVPPVGGKIGRDGKIKSTEGSGDPMISEQAKKFMEKLHLIEDEVSKEKVKKEIEKLSMQDKTSGEYFKLYQYLDEVFSIPWGKHSREHWDLGYSKQVLEKELFGLNKVKERIIEMIAVNKLQRTLEEKKKKGFVILINGPPGVGKTTVAKTIAKALQRESRFISFAGVTDPAFVKGHKRTYVDAQPGVFVRELIKSKVMNPVFILDEMDKLSSNFQGVDPYYALMEILNPEENHNFTDHFLDIKVDFSNVIFILTSNQIMNMLEPLLNRLEVIEVPAYIEQEKLIIAKNYLLPAVLNEHQLPTDNITFEDESIRRIIKGWCYYESGVRELRRCFEKIARKQALSIINIYQKEQENSVEMNAEVPGPKNNNNGKTQPENSAETTQAKNGSIDQGIEFLEKISEIRAMQNNKEKEKEKAKAPSSNEAAASDIKESKQLIQLKNRHKLAFNAEKDPNDELLKKYLGNPDFDDMYERRNRKSFIGTANVLTVSGFVGHVMTVECIFDSSNQNNKGVFSSSGNLEKVLQESLTIARLVAFKFLPEDKIKEILQKNIHIHFLQGGIPKDGPSAGISICAAFLSLMMNKQIPQDISMTGELSLHGAVHKIGGVQAKITASKTLEINRIILPWGNKAEFFGLPKMLKDDLTVYFVKEFREVYNILFDDKPENLKNIARFEDGKFIEPEKPVGIPNSAYLDVKES